MEESVEDPSGVTASSNWFEPVGAGYGGRDDGTEQGRSARPSRKEERTRVHHHDSDHHHPRAARAVPDQASRLEPGPQEPETSEAKASKAATYRSMCSCSWAIERVHSSSTPGVMKMPWFMW